MSYKLHFKESALKEWHKLGDSVRAQFKSKLAERLKQPRVPSAQLRGARDLYKIKLRSSGYRLVYHVADRAVTVTVIAVGKRDKNRVYQIAMDRLRPRRK